MTAIAINSSNPGVSHHSSKYPPVSNLSPSTATASPALSSYTTSLVPPICGLHCCHVGMGRSVVGMKEG